MKLKSIELKGFKSFHNKTKIEFPNGIISIVGPNGSGKSNVLDAFRWVLGEQSAKNLRGDKMEDVIFSGTKRHNQANYCEVEIIFDNEDKALDIPFSEVSIKRKAYRDGESAYYLNGKICRLKEIKELLLDSGIGKEGYSVISQGKIDEIVNSTSVQRRKLLEEASGISKFRFKKEESEKKLEATKINMERLNDIYIEIERQIEPLKKQSEKAHKYLELKNHLKEVEINCLLNEYDDSYKNHSSDILELEKVNAELKIIDNKLVDFSKTLEIYEEEKEKTQALITKLDSDKNELNIEKNNIKNEINKNEEKLEFNQKNLTKLKNSLLISQGNLDEVESKKLKLDELKLKVNSELETLKYGLVQKEALKVDLISNFENSKIEYESCLQKKNLLVESKNKKEYNLQFLLENIEYENKKKQEIKNNILQLKRNLNEVDFDIQDLKQKSEVCISDLNNIQNDKNKLEYELSECRKSKIESESRKNKIVLELRDLKTKQNIYISMENDMEGLNKSVKTILENKHLNGILDVVVNVIKTEAVYEKAVETALGASLQHIITRDSNSAKQAVEFLKKTKSGRATFLPLDTIKGTSLLLEGIKTVSSVVKCDAKYQAIIESLLGRTVLVDNMDEAVILSRKLNYKYRIVTLDGEIFNQGGSITGGHYYKQTNLLGRKRIIEEYEQRISQLNSSLEVEMKCFSDLGDREEVLLDKLKSIDLDINNRLKYKDELIFEINDFENKQKYIKNSIENLKTETENKKELELETEKKIETLRQELLNLESEIKISLDSLVCLSTEKNNFELEKEKLLRGVSEVNLEISKLESKLESCNVENQGLLTLQQTYVFQFEENKKEIYLLTKEISEIEKLISEFNLELKLKQIEVDELNINVEDLKSEAKKIDTKLHQIYLEKKTDEEVKMKKIEEKYRLENKIGKIQVITQTVTQRILEEYQISIEEARQFYNKETQYEKSSILDLKSKIEALGNINLDAIEDYKILSERYELYNIQINDIKQSIEALESIITGLEKDMTREFRENFDMINSTFGKVFSQLFGGGEGSLIISNPSDILNSEIEIVAQPEGKKLKSISVMSGGEKALMAIALLFSILITKPAPFCILDEIDAALDDSNIVRFSTFLEKLSNDIQFITITHRRGTMETSDYIYGVTMQDKGVSKIVSLKFEEATDFIEQ